MNDYIKSEKLMEKKNIILDPYLANMFDFTEEEEDEA